MRIFGRGSRILPNRDGYNKRLRRSADCGAQPFLVVPGADPKGDFLSLRVRPGVNGGFEFRAVVRRCCAATFTSMHTNVMMC